MSAIVHLGVGCLVRKSLKKTSLWLCIAAAFVPDLVSIPFALLGINGEMLSHSLFMAAVWAVLFGGLAFALIRDVKISLILVATAMSHWLIDFIAWPMSSVWKNAPELPLFFGVSKRVGLGLYRSLAAALITESVFLVISILVIVSIIANRPKK